MEEKGSQNGENVSIRAKKKIPFRFAAVQIKSEIKINSRHPNSLTIWFGLGSVFGRSCNHSNNIESDMTKSTVATTDKFIGFSIIIHKLTPVYDAKRMNFTKQLYC